MLLWKYCHSRSFSRVNFRTRFKHALSFPLCLCKRLELKHAQRVYQYKNINVRHSFTGRPTSLSLWRALLLSSYIFTYTSLSNLENMFHSNFSLQSEAKEAYAPVYSSFEKGYRKKTKQNKTKQKCINKLTRYASSLK